MVHTLTAYALGALMLIAVAVACDLHPDVAARYELERTFWIARQTDRDIAARKSSDVKAQLRAIAAYKAVVALDPLTGPDTKKWDPRVLRDIQLMVSKSRLSLVALYHDVCVRQAMGTYFVPSLETPFVGVSHPYYERLELTRTLYQPRKPGEFQIACSRTIEALVDDENLWVPGGEALDRYIARMIEVPYDLASMCLRNGDAETYHHIAQLADAFYGRVSGAWPYSDHAGEAKRLQIQLALELGDYTGGLRRLETLLRTAYGRDNAPELLLLKGEILDTALDRNEEAEAVFETVSRDYPDAPAVYESLLRLARLHLERNESAEAVRLLRELGADAKAPESVRSRALFLEAKSLDKQQRWQDAMQLFRKVALLHPDTPAALEAPLVISRHYAASGERRQAERNLERITEYYLSLMSHKNLPVTHKLMLQDYLVENYLLLDKAEEIAALLERESSRWPGASGAAAQLKAGMIYLQNDDDRDTAARIFKKCIELFPETGYSEVAQTQLEQLELNP